MTFLAVVSSQLKTSHTFGRRLSSVLSKFSHIFLFHSGVTPLDGVTRGGPPLVTPLYEVAGLEWLTEKAEAISLGMFLKRLLR